MDTKKSRDWRLIIPIILAVSIVITSRIPDNNLTEEVKAQRCDNVIVQDGNLFRTSCSNSCKSTLPGELVLFTFRPIPINHADADMLQTIKGVGPVLARKIICYRNQVGPFTGLESLKELQGVGERRARYLSTQFTFK